MNNQEIFALMDRFERSSLQSMKLTREGFSIELCKGAVTGGPAGQNACEPPVSEAQEDAPAVTAPLTGVYYAAPAPDQPPYVTVGQRVKKGQTVCLLEAMKMMSEVPAPCDCIIEGVLKNNGDLAAFGEPLFQYRPC